MRDKALISRIDWTLVFLYLVLIFLGSAIIYSADFEPNTIENFFWKSRFNKQIVWVSLAIILTVLVMFTGYSTIQALSWIIYLIFLVFLVMVLFFGEEVANSRSWFDFGLFKIQPSEFMKVATILGLSYFLNKTKSLSRLRDLLIAISILLIPAVLVLLQGDAGTAIIFFSLFFVLYREGMPTFLFIAPIALVFIFLITLIMDQMGSTLYLIIGICVLALIIIGLFGRSLFKSLVITGVTAFLVVIILSVNFVLDDILKPHQEARILSLISPGSFEKGVGWQVMQSKIAIGSGGFLGKGFLQGTQTKLDYVPEQDTDFIFCTVGEEFGWLGSVSLLIIYFIFINRLIVLAERQKSSFARVYGYGVASIFFFHVSVNISMTLGLVPVAGIPLPLLSYGGSSLWAFTIMLFLFIRIDAERMSVLDRV